MMDAATDLAPRTVTAPDRVLHDSFELALMEGEEVVAQPEPDRGRLQRYMMTIAALVALLSVVGVLALPLLYLVIRAFVRKHNYWLTNSRVIVANGIIGFRVRSIPLERVSDVALSCNFLEKWLGLRSVIVRDMTGEAMSGASMLAAPDAAALQRKILDAVAVVNRNRGLDGETGSGDVYRPTPGDSRGTEMLQLLRQIEKNTRE